MSASRGAILVGVALLGVAGFLAGCGGAHARSATYIARGQGYMAEGRLEKARVEFANALQIAPNNAEARYLSGRVAERLGDPPAAAALYRGAIEVDPTYTEAKASLARLYALSTTPEKALELIEPVLLQHPNDAEYLTVRAMARPRLKDAAGALADAERAVALDPSNEDAVSVLATLRGAAGQSQRAIELLVATIARTPNSIALRQRLAEMYLVGGDDKLAEKQLQEIVHMRPDELQPKLQLAAFYVRLKRLGDAEDTLKAAVAALPRSREAKLAYAEFLALNGSFAHSETLLRELIGHDPHNYDLQLDLAALQQRADRTQDAVATYRAIIAADPNGAKGTAARDHIAAISAVAGNYAEALRLLDEALKINPRDSDALTLRGNISLKQGNPVAAIADLRAVLHEQPQSIPILRTLARAHLAHSEPTLAEENLRSGLAAAPNDLGVRVDLGELLTRTRRADQAVTLLEQAVRDTPDAAGTAARAALVEAYLAKPDLPAARTAAQDLKTLRPDLSTGAYLAGIVAQQQRRPDDAQREFEHALELKPSLPDALAALAHLEFELGQHAQAITLVQDALRHNPDSAVTHNLLGELCLADKRYADAVRALEGALRLAPRWWVPYGNLARSKFAAGDAAGGLAAYEAGVKATEEPILVVELATIYQQQGRFDDAIRQYEILHTRNPQLELAANNLAMLLVTYRKDQVSLDRARDLTAGFAGSDVGVLLDTHGWVMFKRGEMAEALPALQKAAALAPGSKVILYHLGMAQMKAGQADKARTSLEGALAGGASFTGAGEARLALAQIKGETG